MFPNLFRDLAFSCRLLRKSPGFTVVVVLTLSVGVGINLAIYSVIHAVLLSELPYPGADRLVAISEAVGGSLRPASYPDYLDWRLAQHSFDEIAISRRDDFNLSGSGVPERYSGMFVTASYFRVLGVPAKLGRTFFDEEDSVAGVNPIVLSERLWRSRFAADPGIVGRKLTFNTISYEVVGVAADSLAILRNPETARNSEGVRNADLYAPFGFYATRPYLHDRTQHAGFYGIARLKDGVSIESAAADLRVIARNLEMKYPASNAGSSVSVLPLQDSVVGNYEAVLWLLEAAAVFVLLLTCANIANLLLVRAGAREKEMAMRAALGASRRRILSQLLTESVLLAIVGGAIGCFVAFWSKNVITALAPDDFPRLQEVRFDLSVLSFGVSITLGASVLFGLAPAWRLSKAELISLAKPAGGSGRHRHLGLLVTGQVAFACVLLTGAGLLVQTFRQLQNVPLGFDSSRLLTVGIKLPGLTYHDVNRVRFYEQLLARIEAIPGIEAAAIDDDLPFSGFRAQESFAVSGRPPPRPGERPVAEAHCVSPDYFKTMRIPTLRGRNFGAGDVVGKPLVVVVDEELVRTFFPAEDPIGRQLEQEQPDKTKAVYTIVGVVASVRHGEVGFMPKIPQIYWPLFQAPGLQTTLLVRTNREPVALLGPIRATLRSIDPQLPLFAARTMEDAVAESIGTQRLSATLVGGFSILALFLAALGLYGVLGYSVTQRTREIGIRIALGSPRPKIFGLVMRRAMTWVGAGIGIGIGLILAGGPLLRRLVYGIAPYDGRTIIGAAVVLGATAILACLLPATRAVRVNPIVALRHE